ncbi:terminase TerL endonuclease subunit [Nitrosomonas sp.]|uniref:terminase large subunit n=1 Tax=Nitrosomonas sp. TaxID=42353 RepID=UPI0025D82030|nr:terminase TerL endonuclease subunit [Nitrosomonas sp.]
MERALGQYVDAALEYAQSVLDGKILACKWVKAACRRQLDDLDRYRSDESFPFRWDVAKAEHICRFIELLPHIKGKWAGERITLEPWQIFILTTIFGWIRKEDGYRRFRSVYIEVPRKNAKSTLTSGVSLYMLTADDEPGSEVYSSATTRDQAKIVFDTSKAMAIRELGFRQRYNVRVLEHSIYETINGGKYVPLSAEGSTLDGLNIHFASVDELHAHKTRHVYDVIETGTGARSQPIVWSITTAGDDTGGICYEQRTYVTNILNETLRMHGGLGYPVKGNSAQDETYFGIIYTIDDGDSWKDQSVWSKANPNLDVSVYRDDVARLADKATKLSSARNNFLTKRMNVWVTSAEAWMDMLKWESCCDSSLDIADFQGEQCWIGMDLAEKEDFAATVKVFWRDGNLYAFPYLYLNDSTIEGSDNSQYIGWRNDGYIISNDGDVTDFDQIRDDFIESSKLYDLCEIPFDPAFSRYFATKLINDYSLPLVEIRQNGLLFTSAVTELENLVLERKLVVAYNPAFNWMVGNVVVKTSKFSGLKHPIKDKESQKIDGPVALLIALSRAMTGERNQKIIEQGYVSL